MSDIIVDLQDPTAVQNDSLELSEDHLDESTTSEMSSQRNEPNQENQTANVVQDPSHITEYNLVHSDSFHSNDFVTEVKAKVPTHSVSDATKSTTNAEIIPSIDDDDDGLQCIICSDSWTTTGIHRIVSLKCGHFFGKQ